MSAAEVIAQTKEGPVPVSDAEVIGPFAVYRSLGHLPSPHYTVCHTATGHAVTTYARNKTAARKLARELSKYAWWDFSDPEAAKTFSKARMEVIAPLVRAAKPAWMWV